MVRLRRQVIRLLYEASSGEGTMTDKEVAGTRRCRDMQCTFIVINDNPPHIWYGWIYFFWLQTKHLCFFPSLHHIYTPQVAMHTKRPRLKGSMRGLSVSRAQPSPAERRQSGAACREASPGVAAEEAACRVNTPQRLFTAVPSTMRRANCNGGGK